jgi:hypothetical protein
MGKLWDGLTGKTQAKAANKASSDQLQATREGIDAQRQFLDTIRGDLAPYRDFGANQLPEIQNALAGFDSSINDYDNRLTGFDNRVNQFDGRVNQFDNYVDQFGGQVNRFDSQVSDLDRFINDPTQQLNYVQNNPFFSALANDAQNRLLNVQAARGKLGTGDTPAALQNQLMLMGNDLVQQLIGNRQQSLGNRQQSLGNYQQQLGNRQQSLSNRQQSLGNFQQGLGNRLGSIGLRQNAIGQRQNFATMGQNAAAQTGSATQGASNSISDLITQGGNAMAAGRIGAANAQSQGMNNLLGGAAGFALTGSPLGILLSDRRMKCDLEKVGSLDCGIPVYSFRYVGSDQRVVGVMAQDVEPVAPGAVLDVFGVKFVDYDELERVLH